MGWPSTDSVRTGKFYDESYDTASGMGWPSTWTNIFLVVIDDVTIPQAVWAGLQRKLNNVNLLHIMLRYRKRYGLAFNCGYVDMDSF